jgi:hypothetical protein
MLSDSTRVAFFVAIAMENSSLPFMIAAQTYTYNWGRNRPELYPSGACRVRAGLVRRVIPSQVAEKLCFEGIILSADGVPNEALLVGVGAKDLLFARAGGSSLLNGQR